MSIFLLRCRSVHSFQRGDCFSDRLNCFKMKFKELKFWLCNGDRMHFHRIFNEKGNFQYPSLLPPANEVWGKIIFLHLSVILFTWGEGGNGCLVPGGVWSWVCLLRGGVPVPRGVPAPGGCLLPGGCLVWGGAWWRTPQMATAASGMHPTGMYSCL